MKKRLKKPDMGSLLTLLLFGVFAVCVLSVLLTGADAYRRLTERDRVSYDRRTAAQYIAARVRQADAAGQVFVGPFSGGAQEAGDTLFLCETLDGVDYQTRVYCRDGWIWELFASAQGEFAPEDGQQIMQAQALEFFWEGGLLTAEITHPDGGTDRLSLHLRSGEGAAS